MTKNNKKLPKEQKLIVKPKIEVVEHLIVPKQEFHLSKENAMHRVKIIILYFMLGVGLLIICLLADKLGI